MNVATEMSPARAKLGAALQSFCTNGFRADDATSTEACRVRALERARTSYESCYKKCFDDQNESCAPCHRMSAAYAALLRPGETH